MAKTKEELNELKNEFESLTFKLRELTDDELNIVTGGGLPATGAIARIIGPNGAGKSTLIKLVGAESGNVDTLKRYGYHTILIPEDK